MSTPLESRAVPPQYAAGQYLTVSQLSLQLVVPEHVIRRAIRLNLIHTERAGRTGFFAAGQVPVIVAAMRDAGLMPAAVPAAGKPVGSPSTGMM